MIMLVSREIYYFHVLEAAIHDFCCKIKGSFLTVDELSVIKGAARV